MALNRREWIMADNAIGRGKVREEAREGARPWMQVKGSGETPVRHLSMVHEIAVFHLQGEIGLPEFHHVAELMAATEERGTIKFLFVFEEVEHLNYRVFQELMGVAKALRMSGGDLKFTGISPYLFHIFLFAGADQTIDYFQSIEEGVLSFHNAEGRRWH